MATEIDTIVTWNEAAELFKDKINDRASVKQAAEKFESLVAVNTQQGTSKLCYNAGVIYKFLGDLSKSVTYMNQCLDKDPHNAMAYFQRAIMHFRLGRYAAAAKDNQKCVECMRQITTIDYSQLGLKGKLYQHEAIFNEAVCHLQLANLKNCVEALIEVRNLMEKAGSSAPKNLDINKVLQSVKDGCRSLEILERDGDKLYTPPRTKLKNIPKKDYLGKAKVVSSVQAGDTFSGFVGPKLLERNRLKAPPDRPDSPRPITPTANLDRSPQVTRKPDGQSTLVNELEALKLKRPGSPTHPPPKPLAKPKKAQEGTSSQAAGSAPPKPLIIPKPVVYQVELISGTLQKKISVPKTTNYERLLDAVQEALEYPKGTFSLWYMNRQGTYTAIESQSIVEHIWKWKVKDDQMTIYVFGV